MVTHTTVFTDDMEPANTPLQRKQKETYTEDGFCSHSADQRRQVGGSLSSPRYAETLHQGTCMYQAKGKGTRLADWHACL